MAIMVVWTHLAGSLALSAEPNRSPPASQQELTEWFEREVRPLLSERCLSCHSHSLAAPKGNLKLDRRESILSGGDSGPAIVPGRPDESLLIDAIRGNGLNMPPDKPLTKREQSTLERWIAAGAPWPEIQKHSIASGPDWLVDRAREHWAWQPIEDRVPPEPTQAAKTDRALDAFIAHKLESLGIDSASTADRTSLLRRLAFDLTGLPPSTAVLDRVESSMDWHVAYADLVDRYLASPDFGITWGRHWFDLVRYSETLGHEFDYPIRHAWRYRDSVIDSLNEDVSYARFVNEHLAGDLITDPRMHPLSGVNQSLAMTGWWWMGEGMHAPVDVWGDEAIRLDNQIDVVSKVFLGMTVSCARCHDHKFDALSMRDYTSLVGILQSSRRTYAITDAFGAVAASNRRLLEAIESFDQERIDRARLDPNPSVTPETAIDWIDRVVARLQSNLDESRKRLTISHPLYVLLLLAESSNGETFEAKRVEALSRMQAASREMQAWRAKSPMLADFSKGLPNGWYLESADPMIANRGTNPRGQSPFDTVGILPARPDVFASHSLGVQQHLALRSPSFDLTHPMIALRMRGKSAVSSIVVDNYYMNEFTNLLFNDLRKAIDQPNDWGWVVHGGDLNKYVGHPAYVSIEDDEKAWFEVGEIRQCDSPPPAEPSQLGMGILSRQIPRKDLIDELAEQLTWAAANWRSDNRAADWIRATLTEATRLELPFLKQTGDRTQLLELAAATPSPMRLIAMHEGTPRNAGLAARGNPHAKGESIARAGLQALGGELIKNRHSSGRRELANQLIQAQHPLTARVMVNRVWLHLMGKGLVDSPDNFGVLGGAPSHPELLDYLASRFIEHDWSIKWLVREICLSNTYQLSSRPNAEQSENDPTAKWLSHRSIRRISAEKLRDALLSVSGSIDRTCSGESIPVYLTEQMTGRGRPGQSGPLDGSGRRSAFIEVRRNFLDPFLVAFDQPPPATTVGKRNLSNVPAQALSLLNDALVYEMSSRWSSRIQIAYQSNQERVRAMFRDAFARSPTDTELKACVQSLGIEDPASQATKIRLDELAHVLICTKEFLYLQ